MQLTGWQQQKVYPLSRKPRPFSDPSPRVLHTSVVRRAIEDRVKNGGGGGASAVTRAGRKQKSTAAGGGGSGGE